MNLGLTGFSGTGKSTISRYMAEKHDFLVLEGSDVLKQVAVEEGVSLSVRSDYESFFRQQQRIRGMSWLSEMVIKAEGARVMQGGLRSRYDFNNIKQNGGHVLALVCPSEVCLERVDKTNPKNPQTPEEYVAQLEIEESDDEYGLHTGWCVANADCTFDTSSPLEVTYAEIDAVISELAK